MPANDLDLLIQAARVAGDIARPFFEGENRVWDKGNDDPVTEADLAVNTHLAETLQSARPGYGWLSEETEDTDARLGKSRVFIIDPIDGTRAFVAGEKTWAHSIAITEDGAPIAGVVYLPMLDLMFAATRGQGASLNGAPIAASNVSDTDGATVLASRPAFAEKHWPHGVPGFKRHFRPSLAYRLCLVAQGRFDAMLTIRDSWEWDIAAGALIASEAGAGTSDRFGHGLVFNHSHPKSQGVVVAGKALHGQIIDALN